MKHLRWLGFFLCSLCLILILPGCVSTPVELRPAQTNVVELVSTNLLQVVQTNVVTKAVPGLAGGLPAITTNTVVSTNVFASLITNVVTVVSPPVYYTNLSLSPIVEAVAKVGSQAAPVPWGGAAGSIALGIAGTVLALVNDRRRRAALGEKATWEKTAGILVDNVESVRKAALDLPGYTPAIDLQVVRGLEAAQRLAGVKDIVHQLVEARTENTLPSPAA